MYEDETGKILQANIDRVRVDNVKTEKQELPNLKQKTRLLLEFIAIRI